MSDRTVRITLKAEVEAFRRHLGAAAAQTRTTAQAVEKLARDNERDFTRVGQASVLMGAAVAAGLAMSVRAAMEWESAWAGVTKTVDGNVEQMAELEQGLRDLAKTLPASHKEIAAVAEAAGQLGVQRENIVGFTKTMIDLGETTNLTADEAATAIAQIANVMGTTGPEVVNFASTLVALGNAGASTERDIVQMAQRLAGAGKLIGASEADVLAMANAMASMGIDAELGGGAMSRTILDIYGAVKGGGEQLQRFADIAGQSAQQFAAGFGADPVRQIDAFVQGLNRIDESGGNVMQALGALGIEGTQDLQVLLRLKGAGDLLTDSLDLGAQAWEAHTALAEEAEKRYDTTAAKTQIAKNAVNDLAIGIGSTLLPAVASGAGAIGDLASFLGGLPEPAQTVLAVLGTLGATVALLGGAALIAAPKLAALKLSLETLGVSASRIDSTMSKLGRGLKVGGVVGAFAGIALAADQLGQALAKPGPGVNSLTESLLDFAETGRAAGDLASIVGEDFERLGKKLDQAGRNKLLEIPKVFVGMSEAGQDINSARNELDKLDQTLAGLVQRGRGDIAADFITRAAEATGHSTDYLIGRLGEYGEALAGTRNDARDAADGVAGIGTAAATAAPKVAELTEAQKALETALGSFVHPLESYKQLIDDATEADKGHAQESADAFNDGVDKKIKAVGRDYDARLDALRKTKGVSDQQIQQVEDQRDAEIAALDEGKRSWEDYAGAVTVSLTKVAEQLEAENKAHREWRENLVTVAKTAGPEVAQILADMGEDGVRLTAEMATGTTAEVQRMAQALLENSRLGGEDATRALDAELRVMAAVAQTGGKATAEQLAAALELGVPAVQAAAAKYGVVIRTELQVAQEAAAAIGRLFPQLGGFDVANGISVTGTGLPAPNLVGAQVPQLIPRPAPGPSPSAPGGSPVIGHLSIRTESGATAKDIADEVAFQARLGGLP